MKSVLLAAALLTAPTGPGVEPSAPVEESIAPIEESIAPEALPDPPIDPSPPAISDAPDSASSARLRRCISADGSTIYTDRRCQDLQASESTGPVGGGYRSVGVRVRTCAHSKDDLLFGVRSALEAHDVNRFAEYYHWSGMSSAEGYRILDRLNTFSERPLVDVRLTSSRRSDDYELADYFLDPADYDADPDLFGTPPPRPSPNLLRVDQMRSDRDYSSQTTYFRLRANAGCWWLQF